MDLSEFVNYGTIASWIIGTALFIARTAVRRAKGEQVTPTWLPRLLVSNVILGIIIALGLVGSCAQAYLYSRKPKVIVQTVEKPVDRVVEKVVQKDCPKPVPISRPKKLPDDPGQKPVQDNSVHMGDGAAIDQNSNGDCSPNIVGGSSTVNCGPPLPHIDWSQAAGDPLSDGEKTVVVSLKTDHSIEIPAFYG